MNEGNEQSPQTLAYQADQSTVFAGQLAALLLKILAIYFLVIALPLITTLFAYVAELITSPGGRGWGQTYLYPVLSYGAYLMIAALLFWNAERLGRRLVRTSAGFENLPINSANAQAIAFSVVGLYLMGDSLPWFVQQLVLTARTRERRLEFEYFIGPAIKFVIGLIVFLRARGLAVLWHKIRSSGRYDEVQKPPEV